MEVVERLLVAGLVGIGVEDPTSDAARFCIQSYFDELNTRFDTGFDPAQQHPGRCGRAREPAGLLLVARLRGEPIGCGALKLHGKEPAELKRMWVSPRRAGPRRRQAHSERVGAARRARHVTVVRLETNRSLREAVGLYRSTGYVEVDAFNDEPYAHHWFEKRLTSRTQPS